MRRIWRLIVVVAAAAAVASAGALASIVGNAATGSQVGWWPSWLPSVDHHFLRWLVVSTAMTTVISLGSWWAQSWYGRRSETLDRTQQLRRDVDRLREVTTGNLDVPPTNLAIATPDGPVEVVRAVSTLLDASEGSLAITGDPGVGKSVILHRLAASLATDVVYLTHHQLRGTAGQTRDELNLDRDLLEVLTTWTGPRPGLLLLDGLDQTRGVEASSWLPRFAQRLRGTRWRVVGSIRSYDLRHGPGWQEMFAGSPVDPDHAERELSHVAHLVVGDLTSEELAAVQAASPALREVTNQGGERLAGLLSNPFNLNLFGELISAAMDVSQIRSRLDLLTRFWKLRVVDAPQGRIRQRVLLSLVGAMVESRSQQVDDASLTDSAMLSAVDDLLRDGVLREGPTKRWTHSRTVGFAHPVLFDYATAILGLGDITITDSVADCLDIDPDLAMILRPSLDYRFAILWHADPDKAAYWRLALRLAARHDGHVLAAAAAATVAARELRDAHELQPLGSGCVEHDAGAAWTVDDARTLAFLVAAGIGDTDAAAGTMDAFGGVLVNLAHAAVGANDAELALLVAQLCSRASGDHPPASGTRGADRWVRSAIAAAAVGLADANEARSAALADHVGRAVALAATLDAPAVANTIRSVIAEPTLRAWGVQATRSLIDVLPLIAAQDPELAVDVGGSVWHFEDDRLQPTNMLNSQIMPLISNRQQDLESARYQVGEKFPAVAAIDIVAATRLLIRILEDRSVSSGDDVTGLERGQIPRVQYCMDLQYRGGYGSLSAMVIALIDRLEKIGPEGQSAVVLLTEKITHHEIWNRLLDRATTSESTVLADLLGPALSSPSLFAHSQTWPAAGHLAARLFPLLSTSERLTIKSAIVAATEARPEDSEPRRDTLLERRKMLLGALKSGQSSMDPDLPLPAVLFPDDMVGLMAHETQAATTDPDARFLADVDEALTEAAKSYDPDKAPRRLMAMWPRLRALHTADPANKHLHQRLLSAAGQIARVPDVLPDTAVGRQVLEAIVAAIPEPGPPGEQLGVNNTELASWGTSPQTEAFTAARLLLTQPQWQTTHGNNLRALLRGHLDNSEWIYRYLSTIAIDLIYLGPDEILRHTENRLAAEPDSHIVQALIRVLAHRLHTRPHDVDGILSRLAVLRNSLYLIDPGDDDDRFHHTAARAVVGCLTILAVQYDTPHARDTVRHWLSSPVHNTASVIEIASRLRSALNPADPALRDVQQKAFELLALTVAPIQTVWTDAAERINALRVAKAIAQEIYHASGAFKRQHGALKDLGDPLIFAALALPLMKSVSKVHHPAVTHHIIETASHLSDAQPRATLLMATEAITEDPGYAADPLGVDAFIKFINRYMADHREVVLGDRECVAAVRLLLERFVRTGWPQAVHMAAQMDELFR